MCGRQQVSFCHACAQDPGARQEAGSTTETRRHGARRRPTARGGGLLRDSAPPWCTLLLRLGAGLTQEAFAARIGGTDRDGAELGTGQAPAAWPGTRAAAGDGARAGGGAAGAVGVGTGPEPAHLPGSAGLTPWRVAPGRARPPRPARGNGHARAQPASGRRFRPVNGTCSRSTRTASSPSHCEGPGTTGR